MPYLAFDLDALERVPDAADSAGMTPGDISFGLLRLWRHCWREKTDTVAPAHLVGFFAGDDPARIQNALTAFRFIEPTEAGLFRVRGAERYLRIRKAQSDAGKKNAGNLKRGQTPAGWHESFQPAPAEPEPEGSRRGSREGAGEDSRLLEPERSRRTSPALTASSEQRAANDLLPADAGKGRKPKPPNPRHNEAIAALTAAGYSFLPRYARNVTELLALGEPAEIGRRAARARAHTGFPTIRNIADLVPNWDHFATEGPAASAKSNQPPKQECEVITG